ncbi:MAG: twin-arginine translocase subunit TatC [Actinomycetota bacterium]
MQIRLPFRRNRDEPDIPTGQMTVVEHLEELRTRIIYSLIAVALGLAVAFSFYNRLINFLVDPYCETVVPLLAERSHEPISPNCNLIFTGPAEGFAVRIRVSLIAGVALAMPVLLWQLWRFITPALHPREKRWAVPFVASAVLLFVLGAALAYWTLPRAFEFLIRVAGDQVDPLLAVGPYLSFITMMMLTFGICFEFPILLVFLQLAEIIEPRQLAQFRRYAIVLIVTAVAILTPSGDPISLLALSIPMYLFYESSALIGKLLLRRRV